MPRELSVPRRIEDLTSANRDAQLRRERVLSRALWPVLRLYSSEWQHKVSTRGREVERLFGIDALPSRIWCIRGRRVPWPQKSPLQTSKPLITFLR